MRVVVLSPHRDDAAFSCGLILEQLLKAGADISIVNVCTISRYAPYLEPEGTTSHVTSVRREEDAAFLKRLLQTTGVSAASVEMFDLGWQDVPLRWQIADEQAIAALPLPAAEIHQLSECFRPWCSHDVVFAPSAIGNHNDHRLVMQAARQAFDASALIFYEDLPYAARVRGVGHLPSADPAESLREEWLPAHTAADGSKRRYALCYPSQISCDTVEEMERYAQTHGQRECFTGRDDAITKLQDFLTPKGKAA